MKKILLFISILLVSCFVARAEQSDAPELLALPISDIEKSEPDQPGFFDKVNNFFGFGEEASNNNDVSGDIEADTEKTTEDDLSEKNIEIPSVGNSDEGPRPPISNVVVPVADDLDSDLRLPEGFEDDIKEDSEIPLSKEPSDIIPHFLEKDKELTSPDSDLKENSDVSNSSLKEEKNIDVNSPLVEQGKGEKSSDDSEESLKQEVEQKPKLTGDTQEKQKVASQDGMDSSKLPSVKPKTEESSADNTKLAVPDYVSESKDDVDPEDNISRYTRELQSKQNSPQIIPKIDQKELDTAKNKIDKYTDVSSADLDAVQIQFVNNEAQLLILPNDDVVLGELTQEARLELMDFRTYVKIFWEKYNRLKREPERKLIDDFIDKYDETDNSPHMNEIEIMALNEAFKAIDRGDMDLLISLLNVYPILQSTGLGENNLLHEASYKGNYPASKLLILKGINIFAKNDNDQTALDIAEKYNNKSIVYLLKSAAMK